MLYHITSYKREPSPAKKQEIQTKKLQRAIWDGGSFGIAVGGDIHGSGPLVALPAAEWPHRREMAQPQQPSMQSDYKRCTCGFSSSCKC